MPLNPSELLVGQITAEEIKEFTHGFPNSGRADRMANGACDLEMPFRCPGDKLKPFMQFVLGVNYMDTNNNLRRSLPMFHPFWCWAFARSVTVQGQQYNGDDTNAVIWDFQVTPAKWKQYEGTVQFDIPRFPLYDDDEVDNEYSRFVSIDMTPDTKIVTVENGQVHYDATGELWDDQPHFQATIPIARQIGAGVIAKWWHVPEEFLQEGQIDVPSKFMIASGRCNSTGFFNKAAETLLLARVERERYVSPVMTDQIGKPYFLNDITFHILFTTQLAAEVGVGAPETRRGWNMLLGPNLKYWYTRNSTSLLPVVPSIEFSKLFTHWSDTYT